MLDIQLLRNDLAGVAARLAKRGFVLDAARFQELEAERKTIQTRTQELQAKRNSSSKLIGQAKAKGEDTSAIMAEVATLGDELKLAELQLGGVQGALQQLLEVIPNMPHSSVPIGKSEADNLEVRKVGKIPQFGFAVKDHVDLGRKIGAGFRYRHQDQRRTLLADERIAGDAASRTLAVHVGHTYRTAWLYRDLCALFSKRGFDARHRTVTEI